MSHSPIAVYARWGAAVSAFALTVTAAWLFYQAFFVLERFGLMAILLATAVLLAATLLWWLFAEGAWARARTRIRHIFFGGLLFAALWVVAEAIVESRVRPLHLVLPDMLFNALWVYGPLGFIVGSFFGGLYSLLRLRGTSPSN